MLGQQLAEATSSASSEVARSVELAEARKDVEKEHILFVLEEKLTKQHQKELARIEEAALAAAEVRMDEAAKFSRQEGEEWRQQGEELRQEVEDLRVANLQLADDNDAVVRSFNRLRGLYEKATGKRVPVAKRSGSAVVVRGDGERFGSGGSRSGSAERGSPKLCSPLGGVGSPVRSLSEDSPLVSRTGSSSQRHSSKDSRTSSKLSKLHSHNHSKTSEQLRVRYAAPAIARRSWTTSSSRSKEPEDQLDECGIIPLNSSVLRERAATLEMLEREGIRRSSVRARCRGRSPGPSTAAEQLLSHPRSKSSRERFDRNVEESVLAAEIALASRPQSRSPVLKKVERWDGDGAGDPADTSAVSLLSQQFVQRESRARASDGEGLQSPRSPTKGPLEEVLPDVTSAVAFADLSLLHTAVRSSSTSSPRYVSYMRNFEHGEKKSRSSRERRGRKLVSDVSSSPNSSRSPRSLTSPKTFQLQLAEPQRISPRGVRYLADVGRTHVGPCALVEPGVPTGEELRAQDRVVERSRRGSVRGSAGARRGAERRRGRSEDGSSREDDRRISRGRGGGRVESSPPLRRRIGRDEDAIEDDTNSLLLAGETSTRGVEKTSSRVLAERYADGLRSSSSPEATVSPRSPRAAAARTIRRVRQENERMKAQLQALQGRLNDEVVPTIWLWVGEFGGRELWKGPGVEAVVRIWGHVFVSSTAALLGQSETCCKHPTTSVGFCQLFRLSAPDNLGILPITS